MKITFLSHTPMGGPFVVGSHHLSRALAAAGHDVTHVSAGVSVAHLSMIGSGVVRTRIGRFFSGGKRFGAVTDIVPLALLPWPLARRSAFLRSAYSRSMLATPSRVLRPESDEAACLIVDDPRFAGLASASHGTVIYRATDLYSQMRNDPTMLDVERDLCARADRLVATSKPVADHLQNLSGRRVKLMPNGVDFEHFAQARRTSTATAAMGATGAAGASGLSGASGAAAARFNLPGQRENRAVYVGALDGRFGRDALVTAAMSLPGKQFILVGVGARKVAADLGVPNITGIGPVSYDALPSVLAECAVGLLPLSRMPANEGRSPMKLYEYVAAGLSIAATFTEELRRRNLPALSLGRTDAEFAVAVDTAFGHVRDAERMEKSATMARQESWTAKADELIRLATQSSPREQDEPDTSPRAVAGEA